MGEGCPDFKTGIVGLALPFAQGVELFTVYDFDGGLGTFERGRTSIVLTQPVATIAAKLCLFGGAFVSFLWYLKYLIILS